MDPGNPRQAPIVHLKSVSPCGLQPLLGQGLLLALADLAAGFALSLSVTPELPRRRGTENGGEGGLVSSILRRDGSRAGSVRRNQLALARR